jgi:hypothetical protein
VAWAGNPIVNRSSSDPGSARGLVYSRPDGRPVRGRCWRFWFLQRSKRVWFRLGEPSEWQGSLLFRYNGRPILHRRELAAWRARRRSTPRPVLWDKWPELGVEDGPDDCQLCLTLWSRWSWLHPEACGRPGRFSVELLHDGPEQGE